MVALLRGESDTVIAHGEAALAMWPDVPRTPVVQRWMGTVVRCMVEALLRRGQIDAARALIAEWVQVGPLDTVELGMIRHARGLLAQADGDHVQALADFLAYGEICRLVGYEDRTTPWRLGAAQAAAALGRAEQATELAAAALEIAATWGTPGGLGTVQRVRALVGSPDEYSDRLAESVATLRRSLYRFELAGALVDHGIALRRDGKRREARTQLEAGLELAARCKAEALIERARDELHVLGARPRRLMFSGVEGLTATERRVATMAADGLSNREIAQALFVTTKTVETHLRSVYRKLDIGSRRELPERLAPTSGSW
jgi:ATP/maltotriose-dependent transcriptional regulator MalT